MEKKLEFPKYFLWGSSTSSYQVEGGIEKSDWCQFVDAGKACDHYNRYEEDFDLLKKLNQNAFRLSIEWSRIEPEEGEFDEKELEHYLKVLQALKKRGISSFVTLYHWTLPIWFKDKGGWLNPKSVEYFKRYTEKIAEKLGSHVDFWITINEPYIYSGHSYLLGQWPPQEKSILKTIKVLRILARAHKEAYSVIHRLSPEAKVSISKNNIFFEPYENKFINKIVTGIASYFWNDYFLNSIKKELDFIGVNYYFHDIIKFSFSHPKKWLVKNKTGRITDVGWEIYPEGIYQVLKNLDKFKKPIYITENGLADAKDKFREGFIREHLCQIHKAIEEEVDVRGYLHWSLIDNLEWSIGFSPRFGLVEIDYSNLERKPRPSAFYYAKICKENSLICG